MQVADEESVIKIIQVLGKILEKYRLKQNKTIYKISAECAIHKDTWRLIEKGLVKDIKISSLWKIAEGLDITPAELVMEIQKELGENFSVSGLR